MPTIQRWPVGAFVLVLACHTGGIDEASQRITSLDLSVSACGTAEVGALRCWHSIDIALGSRNGLGAVPVPASGVPFLMSLSQGWNHGCGLDASGVAWCWGANDHGQLGIGAWSASEPVSRVNTSVRFRSLAVAYDATCGLTLESEVYCWGNAAHAPGTTPTPCFTFGMNSTCILVPENIGLRGPFEQLGMSFEGACALQAGVPVCWAGLEAPDINDLESLSIGEGYNCGLSPSGVHCWFPWDEHTITIAFPSGTAIRSVSAGTSYACALDDAGRAYCWGSEGEVAEGLAEPVELIGHLRFREVKAGAGYGCGVTDDGAWCWGGIDGNADGLPDGIPARVAGQGAIDPD